MQSSFTFQGEAHPEARRMAEEKQPTPAAEPTRSDEKPAELVQIDKWDGCALKNTLDDHVMKVFIDQLGYVQSNRLVDMRLAICFAAVGAALYALVWDYLHPFPESKAVLAVCVLSYFLLMGVLTLYSNFVGT